MEGKLYSSILVVVVALHLMFQCVHSKNLTMTLLPEAHASGAMCIDGSPPGFLFRSGSGSSADKWIVHLMGGGWCSNSADCYNRSSTIYGSSKEWPASYELFGFFSDDEMVNPDFHNWNVAFLMYCDGGSFAGDREEPDIYNQTKLYYRGYRNLKALIHHLNTEKGMQRATEIILTGCSAGGLAVYLHADFLKTLVSEKANYVAFADAGYFIDVPDSSGSNVFPDSFTSLRKMQNIDEAIIPACKKDNCNDLSKCLFAPYIYKYIKTPIFVLNSQYDKAVLTGAYRQPCMPPNCSASGLASLIRYEAEFDRQVEPVISSPPTNGYFIDSCYVHCQTFQDDRVWSRNAINGRSIADTFGDWYFKRRSDTRVKDCTDFPCNPTCQDNGGDRKSVV